MRVIQVGPQSKAVTEIIHDPELYDRISDDGCPSRIVPPDGPMYLLGQVDVKDASLFIEHDSKIHYMVLRPFRRHARELLRASIELLGLDWMYCEIPGKYMDTINFAKHAGFVVTNITEPKYLKGGKLYPAYRLEWRAS